LTGKMKDSKPVDVSVGQELEINIDFTLEGE
jgi:hypothetical protein